jgi:integrase
MTAEFKNGLAKHPSGYYHYCFRINGQQYHGSTRATDPATARKVLEEQRRLVLNEECRNKPIPTLAEVRKDWLGVHKPVQSPRHRVDVEMVSRLWILPQLGATRLDRINTGDVLRLRSRMLEAGRSPVTVNDMLKILKFLVNFAVKRGDLKALPFRVEFLEVQRKPRPTLAAPKVQKFLEAVDQTTRSTTIHVRVMLRVMIGLGLRESEVRGMRREWFGAGNRTYTVGQAKGKEARVFPVPDRLWAAIQAMPKMVREWVFPAEDGKPHRPQVGKEALFRVCQALGLA